jgi:hypothetical protein
MTEYRSKGTTGVSGYGDRRSISLVFGSIAAVSLAIMLTLCAMWCLDIYIIHDAFGEWHGSPELYGWAVRPMRLYIDRSLPILPYSPVIPMFAVLPGLCAWRWVVAWVHRRGTC